MTPEQIDAVLPRVPAGIPALTGDLTDDEERGVAVRWLLELYREAELVKPVHLHFGADPYCDECRPSDGGGVDWTPAPWPPPTVAVEVDTWPDGHPPAPGITYWEAK